MSTEARERRVFIQPGERLVVEVRETSRVMSPARLSSEQLEVLGKLREHVGRFTDSFYVFSVAAQEQGAELAVFEDLSGVVAALDSREIDDDRIEFEIERYLGSAQSPPPPEKKKRITSQILESIALIRESEDKIYRVPFYE